MNLISHGFHKIVLVCLAVLLASGQTFGSDERPHPNVLLLLTDDLGWQDVGCYDIDQPSPYETPNIDALARKGVMFWQGYSPTPVCSSSRCAIMSGVHAARAQKTHVLGGTPPVPNSINSRMMDPWFSARMPANELTIAKVLRNHGYATGHVGKWHMAIEHHAYPQPEDQGFEFTRSDRGARSSMKDRLANFATNSPDDPYRLDKNGFPFHQNNEDAITFLKQNKHQPFFLYYATWLVHAPIHTRSQALLEKYAHRMKTDPNALPDRETPGQTNPFYGAMVEELDYYVGQVFDYLDETDDPRWPGHKLAENTYVIFTSDNGGMEGPRGERYTDNFPLDRGKISAMEGGTRVPLIITGPGVSAGVQTQVIANGLDIFPTILSMTGVKLPSGKQLDGCDLLPLLTTDPTDRSLVRQVDGAVRDTMIWHFPHGVALESTIRVGDFKLIYNYDYLDNPETNRFELYRLYDSTSGTTNRIDIEESQNLSEVMPEKTMAMYQQLRSSLSEMNASVPHYNPRANSDLNGKDEVPEVVSHQLSENEVELTFREKGSRVIRADLIYTLNGGQRYEEWFRRPAQISEGRIVAKLPDGTTHYVVNLIDENNFLVSYPELNTKNTYGRKNPFSVDALSTGMPASK